MLDHCRGAVRDRTAQFAAAIVSMHRNAQPVACLDVGVAGSANAVAWNRSADWRSDHHRQRLADLPAELRVKAERSIVIRGLPPPYSPPVIANDAIYPVPH